MLGTTEAGMSSLQPGTISLKKDQYIGVDLKNIKAIENIAVNAGETAKLYERSDLD